MSAKKGAAPLSEEAEAATAVLRALVSSKKGPSTLQSILRDFRELEGGPLMYKNFGFPSADEFLKASGEFVVHNQMGETLVYVKPNKESAHILKMVAAQKPSKTKKSGFSTLRQPQKRIGFNNWNPSAYNKMYSQMPHQATRFSSVAPRKYQQPQQQQAMNSYGGSFQQQQRWNNNSFQPKPSAGVNQTGKSPFNSNNRSNYNQQQQQQQQPVVANYNQLRPLMSLKVAPPPPSATTTSQPSTPTNTNQLSQRLVSGRVAAEPNNNNALAKNLNKPSPHFVESPSTPSVASSGELRLPSSDLRHRLNEKQQRVVAPSTPTTHEPPRRQRSALELIQQTLSAAPLLTPESLPGTPARSVNSRLQHATINQPAAAVAPFDSITSTPIKVPHVVHHHHQVVGPPLPLPPLPTPRISMAAEIITPPSTPTPPPTLPGRKSLQDRLKINQKVDSTDLEKVAKVMDVGTVPAPLPTPTPATTMAAKTDAVGGGIDQTANGSSLPAASSSSLVRSHSLTASKEPFSWNQPHATPVEMLFLYSQHNAFARPIYKYLKLKNKRVQCCVTVNGFTYSTYPYDFANEFEGQFAAAQKAIESIKRDEELNNYSVCLDSEYEIATKIFNLLAKCPHGMFSKNIPEAFRNAHGALLPDNWELILLSHARMFSKEEVQSQTIVFANLKCAAANGVSGGGGGGGTGGDRGGRQDGGGGGGDASNGSSAASITSEAHRMAANLIALPWTEQYWNLYITNPVSTVEIWARLVGKEYSDRMDALITDIELSMMGDQAKPKPKTVAVGEYYLVSTTDCWYRVRAEEIDFETGICVCFFIDIGEWERVALDEIYLCDAKYLELPGQSVCFTLDGLEDFGENPKAKRHLDSLICGKVCIGEILTTKEDYERETPGDARIRMILYDTSSDEDINLNSILLKHICDDTPVPELNRKGITPVRITYVDDVGDVHCQLKDAAMVYIQKLINNLVESNALEAKNRGLYSKHEHTTPGGDQQQQLYLVQDATDKKWYRASLIRTEPAVPNGQPSQQQQPQSCRMLYVDLGVQKSVNLSNIYRLDRLSVALSRYPAQAIRTKMFDIPEINDYLLSRLRALLKPGLTAMVKAVAYSGVPLVKVYMHLEQSNILVCVNDSIRSEMELEINSEVISEPRISADANGSSIGGSSTTGSKLNASFNSDYSMASQEAADLSSKFSSLTLEKQQQQTGRKPMSPVPSQITPKLASFSLPKVGELFDVLVTIASNPNYFIVQPYSHAMKLNKLMKDLQEYCMSKAKPVPKDAVEQGEVYAGLNSDDGYWYRVLVVNVLCGPTLLHVYFCDFGQVRVIDSDLLRILPQELRTLPQQAIKAKLYGVTPLYGDWTMDDALRFQELTVERKFASYIRSIAPDQFSQNEDIVELMLIDVSTDDDVLIHQVLVDEKRAILAPGNGSEVTK